MLLTHSIPSTLLTAYFIPSIVSDAAISPVLKTCEMASLCRRGASAALRAAVLESFGARLLGLDAIGAR